MLIGNPGKYVGIILGVAFAAFLIAQQASIFCGLMILTASQVRDVHGVDIWVMDPSVRYIDDILPLPVTADKRIQGVTGVEWATKFYKSLARARLPDNQGSFQQVILLGCDDSYFIGGPKKMIRGDVENLKQADAFIVDDAGYEQLWPKDGKNYQLGKTLEMNDRRGILVGVCEASRTFQTFPIVYTRFQNAIQYSPNERRNVTFVLAKAKTVSGEDHQKTIKDVCDRITKQTGFKAVPHSEFIKMTISWFMANTGIPINFGMMVLMGFIVGTAVAGQTFYLFTVDNIRQFGALKAMGTTNMKIVGMVLSQALQVGFIGLGLGLGGAATFGWLTAGSSKLAFWMWWPVPIITIVAVLLIIFIASIFSLWKALSVEPAIVFKG